MPRCDRYLRSLQVLRPRKEAAPVAGFRNWHQLSAAHVRLHYKAPSLLLYSIALPDPPEQSALFVDIVQNEKGTRARAAAAAVHESVDVPLCYRSLLIALTVFGAAAQWPATSPTGALGTCGSDGGRVLRGRLPEVSRADRKQRQNAPLASSLHRRSPPPPPPAGCGGASCTAASERPSCTASASERGCHWRSTAWCCCRWVRVQARAGWAGLAWRPACAAGGGCLLLLPSHPACHNCRAAPAPTSTTPTTSGCSGEGGAAVLEPSFRAAPPAALPAGPPATRRLPLETPPAGRSRSSTTCLARTTWRTPGAPSTCARRARSCLSLAWPQSTPCGWGTLPRPTSCG